LEVYTDLTLKELEHISTDANGTFQLQFTKPLKKPYCNILNLLLLKQNITIRFYSYDGAFKDLSFLKLIPNIKRLTLHDNTISNLEPVSFLQELVSFSIGKTKSKTLNFSPLILLKNLTSIEVNRQNDILTIIRNSSILKELYIEEITIGDLNQIGHLKQLENLDLTKCNCSNYMILTRLSKLKYLSLAKQNLDNIDFVGNLKAIEYLILESLKIFKLPDFTNCKNLQKILLVGLNKIESYQSLSTAGALEEIGLRGVKSLDISDFRFLKGNKRIKKVTADIKSRRNSNEFYKFLKLVGLKNN